MKYNAVENRIYRVRYRKVDKEYEKMVGTRGVVESVGWIVVEPERGKPC